MFALNPCDAVCTWAAENINVLNSFILTLYPQVTHEETHLTFGYVAIAFGSVATFVVALSQSLSVPSTTLTN
jgi:hypothetical protein